MRIRHGNNVDKVELQMTPMIDIVFQLNHLLSVHASRSCCPRAISTSACRRPRRPESMEIERNAADCRS